MDHSRWTFIRSTKSGGSWKQRKPACGTYNCAGLVWASRRTSIFEEEEYVKIMNEDGYRELQENESPEIGDIVIYSWHTRGIIHIGMLTSFESLHSSGSDLPVILSKWNSISSEDFHLVDDVGTLFEHDSLTHRFWTERPL